MLLSQYLSLAHHSYSCARIDIIVIAAIQLDLIIAFFNGRNFALWDDFLQQFSFLPIKLTVGH